LLFESQHVVVEIRIVFWTVLQLASRTLGMKLNRKAPTTVFIAVFADMSSSVGLGRRGGRVELQVMSEDNRAGGGREVPAARAERTLAPDYGFSRIPDASAPCIQPEILGRSFSAPLPCLPRLGKSDSRP
jgi:hypothetical protein